MLRSNILLVLFSGFVLVSSSQDKIYAQVSDVVNRTNNYMSQNHLERLPLPNFKDSGPLHDLIIKNSKVGLFSSADVKEIHFVNSTSANGATRYEYEVVLGLNPLEIHYDFQLTFDGMFPLIGHVEVAAHKNSYLVNGTAIVEPDGTCRAVLGQCKFIEMADFEVNIRPRRLSYIKEIKKYILDVMSPHYIPKVNDGLDDLIHKEEFRKVFSDIVCKGIKK